MKDRSFSEEELRQREKEERSRRRKQEQAYREAQRGVYSRIYEEQDAMPEDYRRALWDDPQDEYDDYDDGYDGADREIHYDAYYHAPRDEDDWTRGPSEDWTDERRRIQEELGGRRDRPGRQPMTMPMVTPKAIISSFIGVKAPRKPAPIICKVSNIRALLKTVSRPAFSRRGTGKMPDSTADLRKPRRSPDASAAPAGRGA